LKVLVTFALENEFSGWSSLRKFRRSKWGACEAYVTQIGDAEVSVVLTGAGARRATLEASRLVLNWPDSAEFCISSGLAGALRPEYQVGEVLVARSVIAERAPDGAEGRVVESSPALVSFADECGAKLVDRFFSAERVVSRAEEKLHLGKSADAVEMESFAILAGMRAKGIPGVAIRAVSDAADQDLPLDMNEIFTAEGEVSIPRVLGQLALRPTKLPELVKLGKNSKRATESLAAFLDRYIMAFSTRARALEANVFAAAPPEARS
jgi:adenosylhomocysteine nucleosidase